jgi:hypothetical protein
MKRIILILLFSSYSLWFETRTENTYKKIEISYKYTNDLYLSFYMMLECKKQEDPHHCYSLINHCWHHETGFGTKSKQNIFGMLARGRIDKIKSVDEWIKSYKRFWYKNTCSDMVYKSRYTLTEQRERITNCVWMFNNFNI